MDISDNPRLIKQIGEVAELWGNIEFIADSSGASLGQQIGAKIGQLQAKGIKAENINVIVITNKKEKFAEYKVMRVEDSAIVNCVPVLEMLNFALILHLEQADAERNAKLEKLYYDIAGQNLREADIESIAVGKLALSLPPVEKISIEIYKHAIDVLTAV